MGVKPQTLAVWASKKRYSLPYVKVGHGVRYRLTDLQAWLENRIESQEADEPLYASETAWPAKKTAIQEATEELWRETCPPELIEAIEQTEKRRREKGEAILASIKPGDYYTSEVHYASPLPASPRLDSGF